LCFSVQVDVDIKKLAKRFRADINSIEYEKFNKLRSYENELGLEAAEKLLGMRRHPKRKPPIFKRPDTDNRIYSNYFSNVIISQDGNKNIVPMRYRVRPRDSKNEIPTKYNVFNARIDALEKRETWNPLFMKNHGIFPFVRFFEWVTPNKKAELISFKPDNHEIMWAPCLWDEWISIDKSISFKSFAIITDNPPPEIASKGHDRCPIFLQENKIDEWLSPENKDKEEIYKILGTIEKTKFLSMDFTQ
jgi:putative SOS response-associated peptidase YedK